MKYFAAAAVRLIGVALIGVGGLYGWGYIAYAQTGMGAVFTFVMGSIFIAVGALIFMVEANQ